VTIARSVVDLARLPAAGRHHVPAAPDRSPQQLAALLVGPVDKARQRLRAAM
jgi:hypothetical protein